MKIKFLQNPLSAITALVFLSLWSVNNASGQIVTTVSGTGSASFSGDGSPCLTATMNAPVTVVSDAAGNLLITDCSNYRIRKITLATGVISTLAGVGSGGFSGDGGPATAAQVNFASGVWEGPSGNIYLSDRDNHRIRMINTSGTITTVVGTGSPGYTGDGGPATAATLNSPGRVYFDPSGNMYISDRGNYCVRKVNTSGVITTLLGRGSAGFSGDGGAATSAQINIPYCLTTDASGDFYLADLYNYRVRKVNSSGVVTSPYGTGSATFSGDGGAASSAGIAGPEGLDFDAAGNFYIGCYSDNRIRVINTSGTINTFAGTGSAGFSGDGGPATAASFNLPGGIFVRRNAMYVADQYNNRIRRIGFTNLTPPSFTAGATATLAVCENASATAINTQLAILDSDEYQPETYTVYASPSHGSLAGFPFTMLSNGAVITPNGMTYTPTAGYSGTDAFQIMVFDGVAYDTITVNVTISPAPNAGTITGSSTVCVGVTTTLSTSGTAGGTWTSSNTSQATVGSTTGVVGGVAAGTPIISYSVTNGCGTAYATFPITVLPQPVSGAISGPTAVCVGQSITLSTSGTGGSWSASNSNATVTASGIVTGAIAGTDTIRYSVTNSCGTATATYIVTVNPLPAAITGTTSVCDGGNTIVLGETTTGGTWSSSNTGIATVNSTGTVTSTGAGTANISYTITATGCYVSVPVTVNALPAPIVGGNNICLGSAITLTDATTGGNWSSSSASTASVSSTGSVTGVAIGSATISYTNPTTGCYVTHAVTVTAVPPAIGGSTFVCVGTTNVMTNSAAGGTWSTSNAGVASIDGSGNLTGVSVGTATITYTNGGCYATLAVNVGSSPGPITGPTAVCVGATVTLSNASTGGTWSSSNTGVASINTTGNATGISSGSVTISYSLGSGCLSTAILTVNPIPAAIAGPGVVCEGGSTITLTDATSGGSWTTSSAAIASASTATGVITGVTAGTATISYTRFGCYTTTSITVNPQAASVITPVGDTTMCPGDFVILTGPTFSTYAYQWYNGGSPISGATSSYYVATTAGNYSLAIINAYSCLSSSIPMAVTVNPVTAAITAAGATTLCGGSSVSLSATTGAGLSYQWANGTTAITGATNSSYPATVSGNYSVYIRNAAGCIGTSAPIAVTVLPAPSVAISVSGTLSFCAGGSVVLSADTATSPTYQWQSGGVDIAGATNSSYTATTTGSYQVVITNSYPCTSTSAPINVTPIALPSANITVTGSPTFCGGATVPLSAVTAAGNTYQWILNGTPITGATTANYTASTGGSYQVRVTSPAGCVNTTTPPQVLTEMTTPYLVPVSSVNHCWGGTTLLVAHTSTTAGISYQWQMNGIDIAGATNASYNAGPTAYYSCVISSTSGSCSAGSPWLAVTEFPSPNPIITYDGVHLNTGTTFVTYQWYFNYTLIAGATSPSVTPAATGDYAVQVTDVNGCQSMSPLYPLKSLVLDTTGGGDTSHHSGGGGSTGVKTLDKNDIQVFPNPAQTSIHIVANVPLRAVIATVDGRKLIDETNAQTINISTLANGMYMLMLFDKDGQMVKVEKVVKE